jgi:hypothetical protein
MNHKISLLLIMAFLSFTNICIAQNTAASNTVLADTTIKTQQYINPHNISISKEPILNWGEMNLFQKATYIVKSFFEKYTITAWMLLVFFILWLLKLISKLFNRK